MSDEKKKPSNLTPAQQRIADATERRAAKAEIEKTAREEQFANDLEAIEAIENRDGVTLHYSEQVKTFTPGQPVVVGVRAPDRNEYKRLLSKMNRQGASGDAKVAALIELAHVCWVYPEEKTERDAMIDANPGLLASVGNYANSLAEVGLKEEGKG